MAAPMRPEERPLSALPSPFARALAFAAILVAGACGAMIGWSFMHLYCTDDCTTAAGVAAVGGGLLAGGGVSVVAVLTLRAMGEWRTIKEAQHRSEGEEG